MSNHPDEALRANGDLRLQASAATAVRADLANLWKELVAGRIRVLASDCDDDWCYLAVTEQPSLPVAPARGQSLTVLERILGGESQKQVSIDLAIAPSVVAMHASRAVRLLGLDCRFARLPLLVMLAFHGHHGRGVPRLAYRREIEWRDTPCWLIWARRPEARLEKVLSRGELQVTRMMTEGRSYEEIARARNRSVRTVANQLSKTYLKLGVSGRVSLVRWLVQSFGTHDAKPKEATPHAELATSPRG